MKMADMILVSLDDRSIEPPMMYDGHLTAAPNACAPTFHTGEGREHRTAAGLSRTHGRGGRGRAAAGNQHRLLAEPEAQAATA